MLLPYLTLFVALLHVLFAPKSVKAIPLHLNFTEIIQFYGYPVEEHHVQTSDSYILTIFRIPHGRNQSPSHGRPVVFLQHGFVDCSFTWIANNPTESLAFILADAGFDVFLGNSRGNKFSLASTKFPVDSDAFWKFSWDQMAEYDLPACVDYVKSHTGASKIGYVGHSQGTSIMFAALASISGFGNSLNSVVQLAPVGRVYHTPNDFLKFIGAIHLGELLSLIGEREFLANSKILDILFPEVCAVDPDACNSVLEFVCGKSHDVNKTRLPFITAHEPGGTSVMDGEHWAQSVRSDHFQYYDYGAEENKKKYGTPTTPIYDLQAMPKGETSTNKFPMFLVSGGQDELADPVDVKWLLQDLRKNTKLEISHLYEPSYAHLDFVWGVNAHTKIYPEVVKFLVANK